MSKRVVWPEAKVSSAKRSPGSYGSFKELMQKANSLRAEQEQAENYLQKAFPTMLALLEHRLKNGEPLTVMRPLRYQTSELQFLQNDDDGFWNTSKSVKVNDKFVDVVKTINPGTQLVLKSLDPTMQEFIFVDAMDKEYAINFAERNNLMTQTNIFEMTKQYLETRGE